VEDAPGLLSAELGIEEFTWLSQSCEPAELRAGETLVAAGDLADRFYILLEGELRATPRSGEPCRFLRRHDEPPLLIGAIFLKNLEAAADCRLLRVGADDYLQRVASQSPASGVIISGLIWRFRTTEAILHQSEKLASLGKLAAGLTHELNNPAAAGKRAASQLRRELRRLYRIAVRLGELDLDPDHLRTLLRLSAEDHRASSNTSLDPVSRADAEETVGRWLMEHQIEDAWDLAPRLVEAGMSPAHLADFTNGLAPEAVSDALNWVGGVLSVVELITTLDVCTEHTSELVSAVKAYAYMDQAPSQEIDVTNGLESTMVILRHRLSRIKVHREFASNLPRIWAHGNELNQVWTNLLANAIDALGDDGNIWIRALVEGDSLAVEIADDGPGIPEQIQSRIFEPFFTTKDTRHSAGLGLDIVYSIVVRRHLGSIQVSSKPGDTRFRVLLPLTPVSPGELDEMKPVRIEKDSA